MKTTIKLLTIAAALSAMVTSCEDVEKVTPVPNTQSSNLNANFLFVNASPDAPALNFYVNNSLLGTALATGSASTYANAPITTNNVGANTSFHVKANSGVIGGVLGSSDLIFRSSNTGVANFTAANGAYYTLIVVDTIYRPKPLRSYDANGFGEATYYAAPTSFTGKTAANVDTVIQLSANHNNSLTLVNLCKKYNSNVVPSFFIPIGTVPLGSSDVGGPRFLVVTDYLAAPATTPVWPKPTAGKFAARFINASPDAGTASCKINSVTVGGQPAYPMATTAGLNPSVGSRSMTVSFTNDVTTTGSYQASVTVGVNTYTSSSVSFADGGVYTVVLTGSLAKNTLAVTVITNK